MKYSNHPIILMVLTLIFFSLSAQIAYSDCAPAVTPKTLPDGTIISIGEDCWIKHKTETACKSDSDCRWIGPQSSVPQPAEKKEEAKKKANEPKLIIPELQIKLPGLLFSDENKIEKIVGKDGVTSFSIPWIGEYIKWLFNYSLGLITLLALIVLMVGGFYWLLSGGNASRVTEAKNWISAAFSGVILAMSSYILLFTINSNLVTLPGITIGHIKKIDLEVPINTGGSDSDQGVPYTANSNCKDPCVKSSDLHSILSIPNLTCAPGADKFGTNAQKCRVTKDTYNKLVKAAKLANEKGYRLKVTSALRTCAHQQSLWEEYDKNPARVAKPSCQSPHQAGVAVDITLYSPSGHQLINTPFKLNQPATNYIKILNEIMIDSGFSRYCPEWWHFQSNTAKKACYHY